MTSPRSRPPEGTVSLAWAGLDLLLLPGGAVFWGAGRTLFVADLHLGKAEVFRRRGLPLPEGDDEADLARLAGWVRAFDVTHLVVLGDLVHGPEGWTPELEARLARSLPPRRTLVPGNHDRALPPASLSFRILPEGSALEGALPSASPRSPALVLRHAPDLSPGAAPHLAGHLHPATRLRLGLERLRPPIFLLRNGALVLPSWGSFTGSHPVELLPGDRAWADLRDPSGREDGALLALPPGAREGPLRPRSGGPAVPPHPPWRRR